MITDDDLFDAEPEINDAPVEVVIPTLEDCVNFLAGRCNYASSWDGMGFNKFDTEYGHRLADKIGRWTDWDRRNAWKLIRKYVNTQLIPSGRRADLIEEPPEPKRQEPVKELVLREHGVGVRFMGLPQVEYDRVRYSLHNRVPGLRWIYDAVAKIPAQVPLDSLSLKALREVAKELGFLWDAEVEQTFDAYVDRGERMSEWSRAVDAPDYDLGAAESLRLAGNPPWPHQRAGVRYIEAQGWRCLIGDQPGSGKTFLAFLAMAKYLDGRRGRFLWIGPKSTLHQIAGVYKSVFPDHRVVILEGSSLQSLNADLVLVNPEAMRFRGDEPSDLVVALCIASWTGLVVDESHRMKNREAQRTRALKMLLESHNIPFRLAMSGTPLLNRKTELVAQLEIVGIFERTFGSIADFNRLRPKQTNRKLMEHGYLCRPKKHHAFDSNGKFMPLEQVPRWILPPELHTAEIDEIAGRLKRYGYELVPGCLDLKGKFVERVPTEMKNPADYIRKHRETERWFLEMSQTMDEGAFKRWMAAYALVRLNKLRQEALDQKWPAARRWVEEFLLTGEKLVVAVWHKEAARRLVQEFPGAAVISGAESSQEKEEARAAFARDPECKLLILQIGSGGVGLDELQTSCNNIAVLELGWNPGTHEQVEDRLYRGGQQHDVFCHYLLAEPVQGQDTIDQYMTDIIDRKRGETTATQFGGDAHESQMIGAVVDRMIANASARQGAAVA